MSVVSVIVPVFNIEEDLPACVESIRNQTYSNLEIVLVNDGSTDSSGRFCEDIALQDHRIRVIHQENGGVSKARNIGIASAQGDFLCFVDGDDLIHSSLIAYLMNAVDLDASVDMVASSLIKFSDTFDIAGSVEQAQPTYFSGNQALEELLYQRIVNGPVAKLYRAELFHQLAFPDGVRVGEDLLANIKVLEKSKRVAAFPGALYGYFMRPGSAMHSTSLRDRVRLIEELQLLACSKPFGKPVEKAFESRIFSEVIYALEILSRAPGGFPGGKHAQIRKNARKYARSVAFNSQVHWYFRLLALASLASPTVSIAIIKLKRLLSTWRKNLDTLASKPLQTSRSA